MSWKRGSTTSCGTCMRKAAERAVLTHGGMGVAKEYNVERLYRESMIMRIAPISEQMIRNFIGEHVLGMPKSY